VQNLCKSGSWLKNGSIEQLGSAKSISEAYLQFTLQEVYGEEPKLTSTAPIAISAQADTQEAVSDMKTPQAIEMACTLGIIGAMV